MLSKLINIYPCVTVIVVTCTSPSGATGSTGFSVVPTGAATASGPAGLLSVDVAISEFISLFKLMLADTLMADGGVISTLVSSVDVVVLIVVVDSRKDTEKNN